MVARLMAQETLARRQVKGKEATHQGLLAGQAALVVLLRKCILHSSK